jgi:hypothetical protein
VRDRSLTPRGPCHEVVSEICIVTGYGAASVRPARRTLYVEKNPLHKVEMRGSLGCMQVQAKVKKKSSKLPVFLLSGVDLVVAFLGLHVHCME